MTYERLKMQMGVWAQSVAYWMPEEIQAWHVNPLSHYLFFLLLAYGNWKKKKKQFDVHTSLLIKDKSGRKIYKNDVLLSKANPILAAWLMVMMRSGTSKHTILLHWVHWGKRQYSE